MKAKIFVVCLFLSGGAVLSAASITWDGPDGGNWMTPANWSTDIVPGSADDALVNNGGTDPAVVVSSTTTACKDVRVGNSGSGIVTINVNNGGTLQVISSGWMGIGYESGTNGTVNINNGGSIWSRAFTVARKGYGTLNLVNGGTLTLSECMRIGEYTDHSGANIDMDGGTINMNTNSSYAEYIALGYAASQNAVTFGMSGGTINMDNVGGAGYISVGHYANSTATFNMSAGTINGCQLIVGRDGTGTFNLSGSARINAVSGVAIGQRATHGDSILNMFGGTIDATGGNIFIGNGSDVSAKSELNISGGTLVATDLAVAKDGKGKLKIEGSAATIDVDNFYVGGYLTWGGPGTLEYVIKSGGVTAIRADAVYLQAPNPSVTDSVSNLIVSLAAAPPIGDILLIDNQGTSAVNGLFDSLNGGSAAEGTLVALSFGGIDYNYTLTYLGGTGGNDVMLLIPEPATVMIFTLGIVAVCTRRKK